MNEEKAEQLLADCMEAIKQISELNRESAQTVKQLSHATTEQTKTFVMQIEKLSKRLDAAESDRHALIQQNADQGRRIDKLVELLHDAIIRNNATNFIQQQ
ncbi:MAG: hypothetical protein KBS70_03405 [Bacteroidales bacterium]|nr:hypothetical protein [Candidatus Colicola equi]